jgi:hypothetical protein
MQTRARGPVEGYKLSAESIRRGAIERYPNGVVLYHSMGMYVVSRGHYEHWHSSFLAWARLIARSKSRGFA